MPPSMKMVVALLDVQLETALETVTIGGSQWHISIGGVRTMITIDLNWEVKVWATFVKANLLPTTHDTTLPAERVLLIYAFMTNLSIYVDKIIVEEIVKCASKRVGRLFFPPQIIMLCLEASIPLMRSKKNCGQEI